MTPKPKIQYVGQFYIHGSEAQAVQRQQRKPKTKLPMARQEQVKTIYLDPVAVAGITIAFVMLVVMAVGALRLRSDWRTYETMKAHVQELQQENMTLTHTYRTSYDLEVIRSKAVGMGMIPKAQADTKVIRVNVPEPVQKPSWMENVKWFLKGLLE